MCRAARPMSGFDVDRPADRARAGVTEFRAATQCSPVADVTRHGRRLTEERTRAIQRLEKVLQDAGIKLTSVASTILGKTGRAILAALLAGEEDPAVLAELAKGRLRPKIPALGRR